MSASSLLVLSVALIVYAVVSSALSRRSITAPMFFVAVGWLLGASGFGMVDAVFDEAGVELLAEATLVLVLFGDATRINLRVLRRQLQLPARLLAIGLPLTVVAGAGAAAWLIDGIGWVEAFLVGAILAPTDAALGQAVVTARQVPVRIRQALNVESGLNDGIALPLVTGLAVLAALGGSADAASWVSEAGTDILFGLLFGVLIGAAGAWVIRKASELELVDPIARQIATLAVPAAAFGVCEVITGNGFIAAFVAGVAFGHVGRAVCEAATEFTEDAGQLLAWITFTLFGAALVGPALGGLTWPVAIYAVLSLTVVRMIPVALAMLGAGVRLPTSLFLGWFGPRGLASILFMLLIIESHVPAAETIEQVVVFTVLLSIFAHGLSARPLADRYGREAEVESFEMVEEMPAARRGGLNLQE